MEKEQLNNLLGEMLKVRLLAPELKEMTYNDLIRRRKVYETTKNQDKERYDELEAEGFTETDSEMKNLLEHTEKLDKLQEELNIIEKVVKEMPLHELNRKIQVYNTRKNILAERKEELEAEGYKEGDKELDDVNKELFSVNELLDTSNKLKELLPDNMIIEMSTPEPTQTESKDQHKRNQKKKKEKEKEKTKNSHPQMKKKEKDKLHLQDQEKKEGKEKVKTHLQDQEKKEAKEKVKTHPQDQAKKEGKEKARLHLQDQAKRNQKGKILQQEIMKIYL